MATVYRDIETGRFVSADFASSHPDQTWAQNVHYAWEDKRDAERQQELDQFEDELYGDSLDVEYEYEDVELGETEY